MIRLAIIGSNFGKIGLLPAFSSLKDCEVVGVFPGHEWVDVLKNKSLDAVAIAVPPSQQYNIAQKALSQGLHVFAEKPLSANLAQGKSLAKLARKHKIITCVDFEFPEIAEWRKVKELLDTKKFGKLKKISVNWAWLANSIKNSQYSWKNNTQEGGGVLSFYFSHGLYYLEHFAGPIKTIKAKLTYPKDRPRYAETTVDLSIQFKNGVIGDVHVSCVHPNLIEHKLVFECEKGTIILSTQNSVVDNFQISTQLNGKKIKILKTKRDKQVGNEDQRVKIIRILAKRFIKACQNGQQMTPSFEDGLRVQELTQMARNNTI